MTSSPPEPTAVLHARPGGWGLNPAFAIARSESAELDIPGYDLEGELKRGGMGVVFKARQTGLNRVVALKMILNGAYADPETRARFAIEAESVAALEHPNVVKVFAYGSHAGHPYLVMEFLPGGTLADRIRSHGPLPPRESASYIAKLAAAVAHGHSRGVVHRDIKPANVLLSHDGEPRLADFGLAKVGRSDLTGPGMALGTPSYMSPEQAAGKSHEVGTAADVYALGAVLYDLLTGRPPFQDESVSVTLQQVLFADPEPPRKRNPAVPRDLETICLKCLEKLPEKRYPTAQSLAEDVARFLDGKPIRARPAGPVERALKWLHRNQATWGPWLLGVMVMMGGGVAMYMSLHFLSSGDTLAMTAGQAGLIGGAILTGFGALCLAVALRFQARGRAPVTAADCGTNGEE